MGFPTSGPRRRSASSSGACCSCTASSTAPAAAAFREAQRLAPVRAGLLGRGDDPEPPGLERAEPGLGAGGAGPARADGRGAGAAKARTARERAWLDAVEILYGEGDKPRRDTLYSAAMERLASPIPDDQEARAFYALS